MTMAVLNDRVIADSKQDADGIWYSIIRSSQGEGGRGGGEGAGFQGHWRFNEPKTSCLPII